MKDKKPDSAAIIAGDVEPRVGTGYPAAFASECARREKRVLGDRFGLTQFGVNVTMLPPGQWSARRHWHENEDEFVYIVEGEAVLIDDDGEHPMRAGMCAGFAAGRANGHHLVNRSEKPVTYIEIGARAPVETAYYPDDDLIACKDGGGFRFTDRAGRKLK